jgi:hypothetical protein
MCKASPLLQATVKPVAASCLLPLAAALAARSSKSVPGLFSYVLGARAAPLSKRRCCSRVRRHCLAGAAAAAAFVVQIKIAAGAGLLVPLVCDAHAACAGSCSQGMPRG